MMAFLRPSAVAALLLWASLVESLPLAQISNTTTIGTVSTPSVSNTTAGTLGSSIAPGISSSAPINNITTSTLSAVGTTVAVTHLGNLTSAPPAAVTTLVHSTSAHPSANGSVAAATTSATISNVSIAATGAHSTVASIHGNGTTVASISTPSIANATAAVTTPPVAATTSASIHNATTSSAALVSGSGNVTAQSNATSAALVQGNATTVASISTSAPVQGNATTAAHISTLAPVQGNATTVARISLLPLVQPNATTVASISTAAPVPVNATTLAPIQGNATTLAPVPGNATTLAPVPGNATTLAPVPGNATTLAPVPGNATTLAPVPGNATTLAPVQGNATTLASVPGNATTIVPFPPATHVQGNTTTAAPVQSNATTLAPVPGNATTLAPVPGNATTLAPVQGNATTIVPFPPATHVQGNTTTAAPVQSNATTVASISTSAPGNVTSAAPVSTGVHTTIANSTAPVATTSAAQGNVSVAHTTMGISTTTVFINTTSEAAVSTLATIGTAQPLVNSTTAATTTPPAANGNGSTTPIVTSNGLNATTAASTPSASNTTLASNGTSLGGHSTSASLGATTSQSPNMISRPPVLNATATGQQVEPSVFDCSQRAVGIYGNPNKPCDTKFYICVAPTALAYEQPCPAQLYYDSVDETCDSWIHVEACSGLTRPPTQPTQAPSNVSITTVAPIVDCSNKTDGNYPDPIGDSKPFCSKRFYVCVGGVTVPFKCPAGLVYDIDSNTCEHPSIVPACTGHPVLSTTLSPSTNPATLPPIDFDCSSLSDGYYATKCSNVFYSCVGGEGRKLNCPASLIFDPETQMCDVPSNTFICTGTTKAPTTPKPSTQPSNVTAAITTPSPMDCSNIVDGIYPDPTAQCSHYFYFCAHEVPFQGVCPANLFYDAKYKKCDLWLNVFDCSGLTPTPIVPTTRTPPPVFPAVDFDCSHAEDGNYVNPKDQCSQFFYMCANAEAFQQYCPVGMFYDASRDECDSWMHVFDCSGQTRPASTIPPTAASLGTTEKPAFDCSIQIDGTYENPVNVCSHIYYQCVSGYTYSFECPAGLFFDAIYDQCNTFENVPSCSGISHAPSTPSTSHGPSTTPTTTVKPVMDCMVVADGDYADPTSNCSSTYITCASGYTFTRNCPQGTFFDSSRDLCDTFANVPSCTGVPRTTTIAGPSTVRTPRPNYPFDCTKKYDGNYPSADCNQDFWSCVGGLTFPRHCLFGLVYDSEMDDCEFPFLVPKCGGHRIKSTLPPVVTPPVSATSFNCSILPDGNHPDPNAKNGCGTKFVMCSNGLASILPCPNGLFYDDVLDACNRYESVAACSGQTQVPTTTAAPLNASIPNHATTTFGGNLSVSTSTLGSTSPTTSNIVSGTPGLLPQPVTSNTVVTWYNCSMLADGDYADPNAPSGCSMRFIMCSNGIGSIVPCPSGLFYDRVSDKCKGREAVAACTGSAATPPAPAPISTLGTTVAVTGTPSGNGTTVDPPSNGTTIGSAVNATVGNMTTTLASVGTPLALQNGTTPIAGLNMTTVAPSQAPSIGNGTTVGPPSNGTTTIGSDTNSTLGNMTTLATVGTPLALQNGTTPIASSNMTSTVNPPSSNGTTVAPSIGNGTTIAAVNTTASLTSATPASNFSATTMAPNGTTVAASVTPFVGNGTTVSVSGTTSIGNMTTTLASVGTPLVFQNGTTMASSNMSTTIAGSNGTTVAASQAPSIGNGSTIAAFSTPASNVSGTTMASNGSTPSGNGSTIAAVPAILASGPPSTSNVSATTIAITLSTVGNGSLANGTSTQVPFSGAATTAMKNASATTIASTSSHTTVASTETEVTTTPHITTTVAAGNSTAIHTTVAFNNASSAPILQTTTGLNATLVTGATQSPNGTTIIPSLPSSQSTQSAIPQSTSTILLNGTVAATSTGSPPPPTVH